MPTVVTPFTSMTLPVPTQELGPLYAQEVTAAFYVSDAHDHSPGHGAPLNLPISNITVLSLTATQGVSGALVQGASAVFASANITSLTASSTTTGSITASLGFSGGLGQFTTGVFAVLTGTTTTGTTAFFQGAAVQSLTASSSSGTLSQGTTAQFLVVSASNYVGPASLGLNFSSSLPVADAGTDFQFNTNFSRNAGLVFDFDNSGSHLLHLDFAGNLSATSDVSGASGHFDAGVVRVLTGTTTSGTTALFQNITGSNFVAANAGGFTLTASLASGSAGTDFAFNTAVSRSAGLCFDFDNGPGADLLHLDHAGNLSASGDVSGTTAHFTTGTFSAVLFKSLSGSYAQSLTVGAAATLNAATGRFVVATGTTSFVLTDNAITAQSIIHVIAETSSTTAGSPVQWAIPTLGTGTIGFTSSSANITCSFQVVNGF